MSLILIDFFHGLVFEIKLCTVTVEVQINILLMMQIANKLPKPFLQTNAIFSTLET